MVSIKEHFNWTHAIYFGLFLIIMPVYFLIFVCIMKLRRSDFSFQTTFYSLLIQHAIADLFAMGLYAFQKISYILIPNYIFEKQETLYIAPIFYNCFFWFIIIRSNGVALMTLHRFMVIVRPTSTFSSIIKRSKPWVVFLVYWIPPVVFDSFFYSDSTVRFDSVENLKNVVKPETTLKSTIVCIAFLFISCVVCLASNVFIIKYIRENSNSISKSVQRELRLTLQVSFPFGAQLVLLCFMIFANLYAKTGNTEMMVYIRDFFPIANGLLSFISPFTIILFNRDLTRKVKIMLIGNKSRTVADNQSEISAKTSVVLRMR
ncbi:hypothetical protein GCK72_013613 [Caenorhabditis remanei]|uniref:G-protein coupled receptors family 1 profile domain-containing protein n=1 Tax=Caenorhabditis remanei TaxID=31234 RepID=A0A6A5GP10_CAERE|nr:hypothetical protein GCK72_013613 [Caenorhabditis remanei]KAF1757158.1 hypothetical protein GCK72_013613 [Caenorhabditis remanei]